MLRMILMPKWSLGIIFISSNFQLLNGHPFRSATKCAFSILIIIDVFASYCFVLKLPGEQIVHDLTHAFVSVLQR